MEDILAKITTNKVLSNSAKNNITDWLVHNKCHEFRQELTDLILNEEWTQLEDAFFRIIPFGTGGRRGTVGIGSNRINKVTIGEAAQAFCTYLLQENATLRKKSGLVIACDTRVTSNMFTTYVAEVFAGNGFKTYVFDAPRSTPELSFAVKHLKAAGGVVISASHNPSSDNGIKIYWEDGGQMVPPYDAELLAVGERVEKIITGNYETAIHSGDIEIIGKDVDESYWKAVLDQRQQAQNNALRIAFSPLHGTGLTNAKATLQNAKYDVQVLESQANPDGKFTNVTNNIPNPEDPRASDKVVAFGIDVAADLAMTTDPDADRLGVVVLAGKNPTYLTGNQIASLAAYHILECTKQKGQINGRQFIAKTIVTTEMLTALAEHYGVEMKGNLLVGFKYIGELIKLHVDNGNQEFLYGGEESYGGLVGTYARDKDAASTALMIAELAAQLKKQGKTLTDKLDELYELFGYYHESLDSTFYKGAEGFAKMRLIMNKLRTHLPTELAGNKVTRVRDYLQGEEVPGRSEDVLRIELSRDGKTRMTIRPSGTEPKIKIYVQTHNLVASDLVSAKKEGIDKSKAITEAAKLLLA